MTRHKNEERGGGRNMSRTQQAGGKGDLYYRDPEGFERSLQMVMQLEETRIPRSAVTQIADYCSLDSGWR
jgi:hypothetical protein